ncbi:flagellin [bacterium]|nr:flagellin [bacterium]
MALAIATNNAALRAATAASGVNRDMETSMARLSSGKRINSASDDAAGVAISSRLSAEIRGTDQAIRNSLDGQALINTAEGAHREVENILQRMREIAVQAANDTNNQQDRDNLQAEFDALTTEINRISSTTTWAGTKMLDEYGSEFSFHIGAGVSDQDRIEVSIGAMTSSALGLGGPVTTRVTSYDVIRETTIVNGSTGESTVTSEISNENTEPTIGVTTTVDNRPNYTTTTPTKEGSEFKATTYSSPSQENVAIAAFSDGSFVQVWQSYNQDGNGFGIYGQIFDAAGSKYGSEFQINTTTNLDQIHPEVTRLQDNSFAVIWSSNQGDGDGYGVIGRTFNSEGGAITEEFIVNTYTSGNQGNHVKVDRPDGGDDTAIESLAEGQFVVTWKSQNQDANGGYGVYGQIIDKSGSKIGSEFRVNTHINQNQIEPSITRLSNGNFVVSWSSQNQDGSNEGVFGQIFDMSASKIGNEFIINTTTAGIQNRASLASLPIGGFVAAWSGTDVDGTGVIGQIFDSSGAKLGSEFQINTHTDNEQTNPSVLSLANGGFVVAWQSKNQDGDQDGVYAQRFDDDGSKLGSEFQINTYTNSYQHNVFVENLSDGEFIASWQSNGQDAAYMDIFSQIFSTTAGSFEETTSVNTTFIPSITTSTNDTPGPALDSSSNAMSAVKVLDKAIETVNIQRSELGAVSNRLNHTVNNLTNISSNLSAAKGGIEDADFALETTNLAKNQILQQASTAMLAQANASKQNVLSLLQG